MKVEITAKIKILSPTTKRIINLSEYGMNKEQWDKMTPAARQMWIDEKVLSMWSVSYFWTCDSVKNV
jgi:hypothetical protein